MRGASERAGHSATDQGAIGSCIDPNVAAAYVDGDIDEGARWEILLHIDACEGCRVFVSELARRSHGGAVQRRAPPRPGTLVGRYRVLEVLGVGGQGVVVAAYDPELRRNVAIKLLHAAGDRRTKEIRATERLLREAQALARVSHPNVVQVHDVGRHGASVYVAMELVEGQTLTRWLAAPTRDPAAIVDVFRHAAAALVAVHAAGLVHGDFKPHNVLCGTDGRVRVADFGLAVELHDEITEIESTTDVDTRKACGTPRYMAPELFLGRRLDALSDQYAFSVAMWQALCGAPPFTTDASDRQRHAPGDRPTWPGDPALSRIVAVLRRGLAWAPEHRWPSMAEMLAAIERAVAPRRSRRLAVAFVGLSAVAVTSVWLASASASQCTGSATALAEVWDEHRRAEVETAVVASAPFASDAWSYLAPRLDSYASTWIEVHTDTCEATTVRGDRSPEAMDRAMACLYRARTSLDSVATLLSRADAATVAAAHEMVAALPPLSRCEDEDVLESEVAVPLPEQHDAVERARTALARATALVHAGRYADAAAAVAVAEREGATASHGPLETELALARAELAMSVSDDPAAELELRAAIRSGLRERQWDEVRVAGTKLLSFVADTASSDAALRYRELVEGLTRPGDLRAEAALHWSLGRALEGAGQFAGAQGLATAEAELRKAVELLEIVAGPHDVETIRAREELGRSMMHRDPRAAVTETTRAIDELESALGARHPRVAIARTNLAGVLDLAGDRERAEDEVRRALPLLDETFGATSSMSGEARAFLGHLLVKSGRTHEAEVEFERALSAADGGIPEFHPTLMSARLGLARALVRRGAFADAEPLLRRTMETATAGRKPLMVAALHYELALALSGLGRHTEARDTAREALSSFEEGLGAESVAAVQCRLAIATSLHGLQRHAEAEAELRHALEIAETHEFPATRVSAFRLLLGIVLTDRGRLDEAEAELREALTEREDALGWEHVDTAQAAVALGDLLLADRRAAEAHELATRAARPIRSRGDARGKADHAFLLARATWAKGDRKGARALAESAAAAYAEQGPARADDRAEVLAWLRAHDR